MKEYTKKNIKKLLLIIPLLLIAVAFSSIPANSMTEVNAGTIWSFEDTTNMEFVNCSYGGAPAIAATQGSKCMQINLVSGDNYIYLNFTPQDFSSYESFWLDFYSPYANFMGQFWVDFISGGNQEANGQGNSGYCFYKELDDYTTNGWHTLKMDKVDFTSNTTVDDWSKITRIRIRYNKENSSMPNMVFDNLRVINRTREAVAKSPYKSGDNLMINDCGLEDGWEEIYGFHAYTGRTYNHSASNYSNNEGTCIGIQSTTPAGQPNSVGAMSMLHFPATDLSSYCYFTVKLKFSHTMSGSQQVQFNFTANSSQDGYNYTLDVGNRSAGTWHTFTFNKNAPTATSSGGANWSAITALRITWFNLAQSTQKRTIYVDDILATGHNKASSYSTNASSHWKECTRCNDDLDIASHTASSNWSTSTSQHWKDCTTCNYDMSVGSHSYNTDSGVQYSAATCTAKQKNYLKCGTCGYNPKSASYVVDVGSALGHTGGTAYCNKLAVCTRCSTSYGSYNASKHSGSSTYGGTSGVHTKYDCCGVTISSSHTYNQASTDVYSNATCTAKQKNYYKCACGYAPKNSSYVYETGNARAIQAVQQPVLQKQYVLVVNPLTVT